MQTARFIKTKEKNKLFHCKNILSQSSKLYLCRCNPFLHLVGNKDQWDLCLYLLQKGAYLKYVLCNIINDGNNHLYSLTTSKYKHVIARDRDQLCILRLNVNYYKSSNWAILSHHLSVLISKYNLFCHFNLLGKMYEKF